MKRLAFGLIAAFLGSAAATAADAPTLTAEQARIVQKLIDRAGADGTAFDLVKGLTTEIGPRLAGSDAEARARDWSIRELKRLGFSNVRIETFELQAWSRQGESVAIASPYPQRLAATALGGSVSTADGGIVAPVVRFGSMEELKAAREGSLAGKIVFVDDRMARTQDGSGYSVAVVKRSGAAVEGARRGAIAAVIRSVGTDNHRNPHTGNMSYADDVAPIPAVAISNPDADQLARAIAMSKSPVTLSLNVQTRSVDGAKSGNVVAEIPGRSEDVILVSGHLDSWDLGTGAIDDGAGVAIAAAAARLVAEVAGKPKRTLRVVFWGSEERGLVGAKAYVAAHEKDLDRIVLAGESDFGAGRVWRVKTRMADADAAGVFAPALGPLGVVPGGNDDADGSDISELKARGVPIIELSQNGEDYFDLHHTPDDTLDKIDPEALKQNVAAWAVALYLASELPGGFRDAKAAPSASAAN